MYSTRTNLPVFIKFIKSFNIKIVLKFYFNRSLQNIKLFCSIKIIKNKIYTLEITQNV